MDNRDERIFESWWKRNFTGDAERKKTDLKEALYLAFEQGWNRGYRVGTSDILRHTEERSLD